MKKLVLLTLVWISFIQISNGQSIPADSLYLGQTPPGNTPKVFAPGIISLSSRVERVITFSPSGHEIFFAVGSWPNPITLCVEYKNGSWTSPDTASFSKNRHVGEPFFSLDGSRVYYFALPPLSSTNADLYYSEKTGDLWSDPISLGSSINTSGDEFHPNIVNDGSIYFADGMGQEYRSQFSNNSFQTKVALADIVNSGGGVWGDHYIAPDESYLIYHSRKTGGYGSFDLYISYKRDDGTWTNPKNIGDKINTSAAEKDGDITPDGKFMTFSRDGDIYWVSASFIDSLKLTNFIPYLKNAIPNSSAIVGQMFSYTIPESTFIDDDGNNTLTYSVSLSDGSEWPSWLKFAPDSLTFNGTPSETGSISIKVSVKDNAEAIASTTFIIEVQDNPTSLIDSHNQNIRIYPNPTNDILNVSSGTLSGKTVNIEICNLEGKTMLKKSFKNDTIVDLSRMQKGVYLIKLFIDNELIIRKLCVE